MDIFNVGDRSINVYLLDAKHGQLMVDCGWPGAIRPLYDRLKSAGISKDIRYLLITHFHPDHAGLAQELKNNGTKLLLLENQALGIMWLNDFFDKQKKYRYLAITPNDNVPLKFEDSRKFLGEMKINGEIIPTPGHSEDHVTLILDEGCAFTGDLPPRDAYEGMVNDRIIKESWRRILGYHIKRIYPGHGNYADL